MTTLIFPEMGLDAVVNQLLRVIDRNLLERRSCETTSRLRGGRGPSGVSRRTLCAQKILYL